MAIDSIIGEDGAHTLATWEKQQTGYVGEYEAKSTGIYVSSHDPDNDEIVHELVLPYLPHITQEAASAEIREIYQRYTGFLRKQNQR